MSMKDLIDNLYDKAGDLGEEGYDVAKARVVKEWNKTRVRWGVFGYAAGVATVPLIKFLF